MRILSYNAADGSYFLGASGEEAARLAVPFTNAPSACRDGAPLSGAALCAIYGIREPFEVWFVLAGDLSHATYAPPQYPVARDWRGFSPWRPVVCGAE